MKVPALYLAIFIALVVHCPAEAGCLENEPISIVLRNDDVGALSNPEWERKLLNLFIERGVRQSVGFVPEISENIYFSTESNYYTIDQSPEIIKLYQPLIHSGLVDPVQHGLLHQSNYLHAGNNIPTSMLSEFSGLPSDVQLDNLRRGRSILERTLQSPVSVFIPPWNSLDDVTILALRELGFSGISEKSLYTPNLPVVHVAHSSTTLELKELPSLLHTWMSESKCDGNLAPKVYVFLYHSWSEYSEDGVQRMADLLDQVTQSGVKVTTLSAIFRKLASPGGE